jgi:hypothetical protein
LPDDLKVDRHAAFGIEFNVHSFSLYYYTGTIIPGTLFGCQVIGLVVIANEVKQSKMDSRLISPDHRHRDSCAGMTKYVRLPRSHETFPRNDSKEGRSCYNKMDSC